MIDVPIVYGRFPNEMDVADLTIYRDRAEATWEGDSEYLAISKELIEQCDPDVISIDGNIVIVRQFKLELVTYYNDHGVGTYLARRIAPPMDESAPTTIDEIVF
jgi:hypothetical protein